MSFNYRDFYVLTRYRRFPSLRKVKGPASYKSFFRFYWLGLGSFFVIFLLLPWQQSVSGVGRVIAFSPNERRQEISASLDGRVKHWRVNEGAQVKKGDLIVELEDNDPHIIERLEHEMEAAIRKLDAAKVGIETSLRNIERQIKLQEKGLSAPLSIENARLKYNKYLVDEADASSELARIEVKISRQNNLKVYSPIDGFILKINAGQGGQLVKQGESLAVLIPETNQRAIEVWVRGRDMPLLSEGREVRIQFEGWPAVQFSGWPMVAVGTFGGVIKLVDAADDGMGNFRIIVFQDEKEDWPDPRYLRQGVRVKAWVLLDQVRVGYEMWRIFNGFPPALKSYYENNSSTKNGHASEAHYANFNSEILKDS